MSLKDEIDKLIASERTLLEHQDKNNRDFFELQETRFRPLRSAFEEMSKALDPAYVQVVFMHSRATVKVGQYRNNDFHCEIQWEIEPNSQLGSPGKGAFLEPQPGFSIEETEWNDFNQETYTLQTETEVVQHIVKKIASKIAFCQHNEDVRNRSSGR